MKNARQGKRQQEIDLKTKQGKKHAKKLLNTRKRTKSIEI